MKKFHLIGAAVAISLSASAQLTVTNNGQTIFGKYETETKNSPFDNPELEPLEKASISAGIEKTDIDTLAAAVFIGNGTTTLPYITFGEEKRVWIGEYAEKEYETKGVLHLEGKEGLEANWEGGNIFQIKTYGKGNAQELGAFTFNTPVKSPVYTTISDSRYKTKIESIDNVSSSLGDLRPVSYQLTVNTASDKNSSKFSQENLGDGHTQFGFLAQEVREVYPDLVIEDEEGILGINYDGFIPILVDAIQHLQARISEQETEIARLSGGELRKQMSDSRLKLISEGSFLAQNRPNPFQTSTVIDCAVSESVSSAAISVYDLQGKQIISIPVTERGATSITIEGNTLQSGMYIYALIADGVEIDSKRMILTD